MAVLRDTLSCTALAVTAAWLAASATNPLTLGTVIGGVTAGAAGNLAHGLWTQLDRTAAAKALRAWRGIDENHIVVQALRKSYLQAQRGVLKEFRAVASTAPDRLDLEDFAASVQRFIETEWTETERLGFTRQGSLTPAEHTIRQKVIAALPGNFSGALGARRQLPADSPDAVFATLRKALIDGALEEIESRTLPEHAHVPPLFSALFLGTNTPHSWFDLFLREAADRLKNEPAFEAIWNAEQIAHANLLLDEVRHRIERLERMVGAPIRSGEASAQRFAEAIRRRPTNLLLARYRVVPYIDRGGVLAEALGWARSVVPSQPQGRLYAAPGGFGKTRFAIELLLRLAAEGWTATFLSPQNAHNLAPGALDKLFAEGEGVGCAIVLDYAESQIALLEQVAAAAVASAETPICIVALARSAEGWWRLTRDAGGMSVVFEPASIEVIEQPLTEAERGVFLRDATTAFVEALSVAGLTPAETTATAEVAGRRYDRPLTVAMAAFLAARGIAVGSDDSVFERIFLEERRQWRRVLRIERDNDPLLTSLHRAAAQVTLVQGATLAGARALIGADPRACSYGIVIRDQCVAALQTLYGVASADDAFLRPIEPDLLGEHAAMAALGPQDDGLAAATLATVLRGPPCFREDLAAIFTTLARATQSEHDARTRRAAQSALDALREAVAAVTGAQARMVEASLPRFSVPLLRVSAAVAGRVAETSEDAAEEARALNDLSVRLSETGDRQAALAPAQRAVEIREALARDNPAAYLPALAMSLNTLAVGLSETGDRQAALAPARRAAELYEALARDNPAAYLPALAMSLNNLAIRLSETGDRQAALAPARRAVEIREALARDNPAAYLPDLAMSLNNLAVRLSETGDRQAALAPARRAVELHEALARDNPAAYLPDLASSLNNLANRLSETGDRQAALAPARRAAEIREALARDNPAAYLPALASSLNTLAVRLSETGDRQAALAPARRAVEIREALARDNPAAYLPDLAMSLNNLANSLSETGDRQAVLAPARRAVELCEALARDNPAAYLPDLAMSLNNLANHLSETGDRQAALAPARRAVEIREALARDNPAAYLPVLASSLNNLAIRLSETGDRQAALAPARRAVELYEVLAGDNPAAYLPYLAGSLNNLANHLSQAGDRQAALAPARRAVELYEALARDYPAAYQPNLQVSCATLGSIVSALLEAGSAVDPDTMKFLDQSCGGPSRPRA